MGVAAHRWAALLMELAALHVAHAGAAAALGLDMGQGNSVIAVARRGGVDVVANEATRRQTPSLVAFDTRQRRIGEIGAALRTSSPRSVVHPKRLVTQAASAAVDAHEPSPTSLSGIGIVADSDGKLTVEVEYLGARRRFSPIQLLAMLLYHLRITAERDVGASLTDAVVAVPAHLTAAQRRAVVDAGELSGLRTVRLISDGVAAGIDYSLSRRELPAGSERIVAIVDAGESGVQVSILRVWHSGLRLLSYAHAAGVGGAGMDIILLRHFAAEISERYGLKPLSQPRPAQRLLAASERLRRVLSANTDGSFSLDCLMGETDVSCSLTRHRLEALCAPLLARAAATCDEALRKAKLPSSQPLHAVELVGGCSRMPALAAQVEAAFNLRAGHSLNAEETVARGAALAAALHSRSFKAVPFEVHEGLLHPHALEWAKGPATAADGAVRLKVGTPLPLHKRITLKTPGSIHLRYLQTADPADATAAALAAAAAEAAEEVEVAVANSDEEEETAADEEAQGSAGDLDASTEAHASQPATSEALLVHAIVKPPAALRRKRTLRIDLEVDANQLPTISAYEVLSARAAASPSPTPDDAVVNDGTHGGPVDVESRLNSTDEAAAGADAATDGDTAVASTGGGSNKTSTDVKVANASEPRPPAQASAPVPAPARARTPPPPPERLQPLKVVTKLGLGLAPAAMAELRAAEEEMRCRDQQVELALAAKNDLEASIYTTRGALSDSLAPFCTEAEREALQAKLEQMEDWLYAEGEFVDAANYEAEAAALASECRLVQARADEHAEALRVVEALTVAVDDAKAAQLSSPPAGSEPITQGDDDEHTSQPSGDAAATSGATYSSADEAAQGGGSEDGRTDMEEEGEVAEDGVDTDEEDISIPEAESSKPADLAAATEGAAARLRSVIHEAERFVTQSTRALDAAVHSAHFAAEPGPSLPALVDEGALLLDRLRSALDEWRDVSSHTRADARHQPVES